MCGVSAIYGMSINEALKLSDAQVSYMLDQAGQAAHALVQENPAFKRTVGGQVMATTRAVTEAVGSDFSDAHMKFAACSADMALMKLFFTSTDFQQALRQRLAPVTRGVRSLLENNPGDGGFGGGGGGLGPPPGI
jgi:hypothetical protein